MINIAPLASAEPSAIERLLDSAFGADRHGRTAYRIRAGVAWLPDLSFGAFQDDVLVGSIQSWPVALRAEGGGIFPLILVGPVAVSPDLQRAGIGRNLMAAMLEIADAGAASAMVMIGDPEYYGRFFSFSADATTEWQVPGPVERHRLLARIRGGSELPARGELIPDPAFATERVTA